MVDTFNLINRTKNKIHIQCEESRSWFAVSHIVPALSMDPWFGVSKGTYCGESVWLWHGNFAVTRTHRCFSNTYSACSGIIPFVAKVKRIERQTVHMYPTPSSNFLMKKCLSVRHRHSNIQRRRSRVCSLTTAWYGFLVDNWFVCLQCCRLT